MNVFLPLLRRQAVLSVLALASACFTIASAQTAGAYKQLTTRQSVTVADTLSGMDLGLTIISPLAQHGIVQVQILQSGGTGQPYEYRVSYSPNPGFTGIDTFTLELNYVGTFPYLVYLAYQVYVYPSLLEPRNDFTTTTDNTPVTVNVLTNDVGSNGPLTVSALPLVDHGTATFSPGGQVIFTPEPGFFGTAHIDYTVCDAIAFCKTAALHIGVHPAAPASFLDTLKLATLRNRALSIPLPFAGYTVAQAPSSGTVQLLNGGQVFRYTPDDNFSGIDEFTLQHTTYGTPALQPVRIDVLNVALPNQMAMQDIVYTPRGQALTFNVLDNDIGNLTVKSWIPPAPQRGTISNTAPDGSVTFTPAAGFTGVATFTYKLGNQFVPDLETGTVHVIVSNLPPRQANFDLTTLKNTPLVIDYAVPYTAFNFNIVDAPEHGTCNFYPGYSSQVINGQTISGENLLIYMPQPGYTGTDEWAAEYCLNGQCQAVGAVMHVVNIGTSASSNCVADCVWPGDANVDGRVDNEDVLAIGYHAGTRGPSRANASLTWYGQSATDWNNAYSHSPYDLKHVDSDGNGLIAAADTVAISQHYHATPTISPGIPAIGKGLPFYFTNLTPDAGIGDLVQIEVSLGNAYLPVTDLHGFTLNATLSPLLVDSLFRMEYYPNSWIAIDAPYLTFSQNPAQGRVESAFSRVVGLPTQGYGPIGTLSFVVIDVIEGGQPGNEGGSSVATLTVQSSAAQWGDGTVTAGQSFVLQIPVSNHTTGEGQPVAEAQFFVYPSPASTELNVYLNGADVIESLALHDLAGRVVYQSGSVAWERATIDVSRLPTGPYVAVARTRTGQVAKRFEIVR
jgi:hypothetical protein